MVDAVILQAHLIADAGAPPAVGYSTTIRFQNIKLYYSDILIVLTVSLMQMEAFTFLVSGFLAVTEIKANLYFIKLKICMKI